LLRRANDWEENTNESQGLKSRAATGNQPLSALRLFWRAANQHRYGGLADADADPVDGDGDYVLNESTVASAGVGAGGGCVYRDQEWLVDSD